MRRYRSEQALTQQQLGDRLSWTQSRVSRLERGDLPVSVDRLTQVAAVLGIHVAVHVLPVGQAVERLDSSTWDVRSGVDAESGAALHVALRLDT